MNRDGYRGDRSTAEHEAAHAVIACRSGLMVYQLSIAPSKAARDDWAGACWHASAEHCGPSVSGTAVVDAAAAGGAWALHMGASDDDVMRHDMDGDLRKWIERNPDTSVMELLEQFAEAMDRTEDLFDDDDAVDAAVREVADALQAHTSGQMYGGVVERVCLRHGLTDKAKLAEIHQAH